MKRVALAVLLLALVGVAACGDDQPAQPSAPPEVVVSDVDSILVKPEVPSWAKVAPEQIAEAKKHGVPVAFENDLGMRFVLIPAGTFLMGSRGDEAMRFDDESPQHEVTFLRPFYLATTETTQAVWESVMGNHPSETKGAALPVTDVSWEDCKTFVKRLNETAPGGYRLPTEAEWEYACRAGTTTAYWSGDKEEDLARVGWYEANSGGRSHAVGEKPANAWGLHDTHGNVWEWCEDAWHDSYEGAPTDGKAWLAEGSGGRVYRGGSWGDVARHARSSLRLRDAPGGRDSFLGVRPARSVTP